MDQERNPRGCVGRHVRWPGQQRGAKRTAATGTHCEGVGRAEGLRGPRRPTPRGSSPAPAPPPPLLPGLCCGATGEFHYPSGPSVLRETGVLTKRSFGERMDIYSVVHPEHGILLSTKQK